MVKIENLDYLNIRDAHVHGIINPTFNMYGNCDLKKYNFEVYVDGKLKDASFKPDLASDNYELFLKLNNTDSIIEVYLVHDEKKELVCIRKNTRVKRIKSKIRVILKRIKGDTLYRLRDLKFIFIAVAKELKYDIKNRCFILKPTAFRQSIQRMKDNKRMLVEGIGFINFFDQNNYLKWLEYNEKEDEPKLNFNYRPLISICIPVYNVAGKYLSECLDSILNQSYQNFEICISNDCSTLQETIDTLNEYEAKDNRIKVFHRKQNGHISKATNDALAIASGDFIGLMDNDDLLAKNALYECVKVLNENPELDFIYTDEDKMDMNGKRRDPHFKSDFAPDTILGSNYICHFEIMRKSIVDKIGGFRVGLEGAQDYDLFLRFFENTTIDKIYHIPKILYHWRMIEGSTAAEIDNKGYAVERGRQAVEDAMTRRGIDAEVTVHPKVPYYCVNYKYEQEPKISIIIPTKDNADITEQCLKSLFEKTTYKNYEVIVMNNNSSKKATFDLFDKYKEKYSNFRVIDANYEFNYSKINNQGVKDASGEYILLLNNDTEIITPNWLEIMVGYAMQPHIGAVGAKLLYPDNTVQHAGVILGIGGIAQHTFIGCSRDDPGFYGRLSVPFNYSAVTAACLMVSKQKFIQVGGLEETLKVAFNDIDFNLKLLKAGYYNVCLNQVELYHYESKSRGLDTKGEKYKRFVSEHDYMKDKWGDLLYNDKFYNPNLSLKKAFVLDDI
ncbi:glycosyltransferase family 2 protein [uncultured Thomasclavelia sp.]|uniref:glycosyltransferase family 2 protein n=1 Tax=uncultured Thomasclavelia sp. TaxID=3025759 RepID=UPI0025E9EF67|nr:glycosyltransferase family 2 protein [uncultured Thomasclavelia sp.]